MTITAGLKLIRAIKCEYLFALRLPSFARQRELASGPTQRSSLQATRRGRTLIEMRHRAARRVAKQLTGHHGHISKEIRESPPVLELFGLSMNSLHSTLAIRHINTQHIQTPLGGEAGLT